MCDTWSEDAVPAEPPFAADVLTVTETRSLNAEEPLSSWLEYELDDGQRWQVPFAEMLDEDPDGYLAESRFATQVWAPSEAWPPAAEHLGVKTEQEGATVTGIPASRLEWPGASAEQLAFMRAVYNEQVERSKAKGAFTADLPKQDLDVIEGAHYGRKDAAEEARALLAEARAALRIAGLADRVRIGVISAYRPASHQFVIWQGKGRNGGFPHYYNQMLKGRLSRGDHSPGAVAAMAEEMARWIAAPGYSNHQDGLAIDFGVGSVGGHLGKIRGGSWFHCWLVDNAARFKFYPYDTEAWHWTYRGPGGSKAQPSKVATGAVRAGELQIPHANAPDLILRWNVSSAPKVIDVVVHLHGYWYSGMNLARDIKPVSGLDLSPVAGETGPGRSRPTLTVLPRGHDTGVKQNKGKGPYNVFTFPKLVTKNGLTDLIHSSLDRYAAAVGGAPPRVGRLILTAHSGGGAALLQILRYHGHDVHQVHVFDALYQDAGVLADWAHQRIRRDLTELSRLGAQSFREYMQTSGGALRVFYQDRTRRGARPCSLRLRDEISAEVGSGLRAWYRVEASRCDHFQIPNRYGWRLLVDASADVPDAYDEPVAHREVDNETAAFEEWEKLGLWGAEAVSGATQLTAYEVPGEMYEAEDGADRAPVLYPDELDELTPLDAEGFLESEELFEAEEFARHAVYEAAHDENPRFGADLGEREFEEASVRRPRILTTAQVRQAWHMYECAEHRMVPLRLFGKWNTLVNSATVDAWRALEQALIATGYLPHRAWVYNCRDIAGQKTRSLHAYGLAIDIDHADPICNVNRPTPDRRAVRFSSAATADGRCQDVRDGKADTSFTPDQVAAVEAIQTIDGHQVFLWGGRWRTIKDTMHFQISVTPAELAHGIRGGVPPLVRAGSASGASASASATAAPSPDPPVRAPTTAAAARFNRGVPERQRFAALVPLLDRHRGDIPLDFLLGWIDVESNGRIDVITSLDERGFFQIHPAESKDHHLQHERLTTDPDYSVQAGIQLVRVYVDLARRRYPWIPPGSDLFWRIVKLQHAMGSSLTKMVLSDMRSSGTPPTTWEAIKAYELTDAAKRLHKLLRVKPGRFGRNVDSAFARGRRIATLLSR